MVKAKAPTNAQLQAKALKACNKNARHKCPSCEHQARKRHATTNRANAKHAKPKQAVHAQRGTHQ
jgi:hypothetical protein